MSRSAAAELHRRIEALTRTPQAAMQALRALAGALRVVREMLHEGGLRVDTTAELDGARGVAFRTLVQLDGDCALWIDRRALGLVKLYEAHLAQVEARLAPLAQLRKAKWGALAGIPALMVAVASFLERPSSAVAAAVVVGPLLGYAVAEIPRLAVRYLRLRPSTARAATEAQLRSDAAGSGPERRGDR